MENNISTCRKKAGLTQVQLAQALGFRSTGTVSQWESGDRSPRASMLPKIADVLGCTIDELLRGEKPSTKAAD